MEQTEEIDINGEGRTTRIGTRLSHDQKGEMTQFLRENSDVIVWSAAEIPGISPLCHFSFFKCQPSVSTYEAEEEEAQP